MFLLFMTSWTTFYFPYVNSPIHDLPIITDIDHSIITLASTADLK